MSVQRFRCRSREHLQFSEKTDSSMQVGELNHGYKKAAQADDSRILVEGAVAALSLSCSRGRGQSLIMGRRTGFTLRKLNIQTDKHPVSGIVVSIACITI